MHIIVTLFSALLGLSIAFFLGFYAGVQNVGSGDTAGAGSDAAGQVAEAAAGAGSGETKAKGAASADKDGGNGGASADGKEPDGGGAPQSGDGGAGDPDGATADSGGGSEAEKDKPDADPPPWLTDMVASLKANGQTSAGDTTAAAAGDSGAAGGSGKAAGQGAAMAELAPGHYAVQTRRPLPTPEARALASRWSRPPLTPTVVPSFGSDSEAQSRSYVRFPGFANREEAEKLVERLQPDFNVNLSIVRVASQPTPDGT